MKYKLLLFVSILALFAEKGNAQKPEPVYGFAVVTKPLDWYRTQRQLWKKETETNPGNALAWYYLYKVSRNLNRLDSMDKRPRSEKINELKSIVEAMGKAVPESYEYNLTVYANGGLDDKLLPYLKKAEALGKDRTEHLEFSVIQAELDRNISLRDEIALKMTQSVQQSPGLMYYAYNMIAGLKPNAIIFTCGDNDTYPIWMLQSMGIRKDITAINTTLVLIKRYREKLFREAGLKPWPADPMDSTLNANKAAELMDSFRHQLVGYTMHGQKNKPVYVSLTCDQEIYQNVVADVYLTGLAWEISSERVDQAAVLRKNFESLYKLDYIEQPFYQDISQGMVDCINQNYIVPMVKLYQHYTDAGETTAAERLKPMILFLAKDREDEADILKQINR